VVIIYTVQNMSIIPIERMATLAACFVRVVFSGYLRIFLGKASLWCSFSLVLRLRFVSPMDLCSQLP